MGKARWAWLLGLGFVLLCPAPALAGVADRDPSFGKHGLVAIPFEGDATASAVAIAPDGDIVVAGYVETTPGTYDSAVARLDRHGRLDDEFSGDGRLTLDLGDGGSDVTSGVAVDADGRIVVAASAENAEKFVVARLLANGDLDAGFADQGIARVGFGIDDTGSASDVAIDADERILVVGSALGDATLARLTPDGELDHTFSDDGKLGLSLGSPGSTFYPWGEEASAVTVLPGGDIAIAGRAQPSEFTGEDALYGLVGADGSVKLLEAFTNGRFYWATDIAHLSTGDPLLVGSYQPWGPNWSSATAWLFDSAGAFEEWQFARGGYELEEYAEALAVTVLSDDRAVIPASFRADSSGLVDYELLLFTPEAGFAAHDAIGLTPRDVAADATDRVVLAGECELGGVTHVVVARLAAPDSRPSRRPISCDPPGGGR